MEGTFPHKLYHMADKGVVPSLSLSYPQGLLTHVTVNRASSTMLPRQGTRPTLLSAAAGEELGQLFWLLQVMRGEIRRVSFSYPHQRMADGGGGQDQISHSRVLKASSPAPQQTWSILRQGRGSALLSAVVSEGQGQLCGALCCRTLVVTGALKINTDHSYGTVMDLDMDLGSSPGTDITMFLGSKQATHLSSLLATFTFSDLSLSTAHEPFCVSLSHTPPYICSP